MTLELTIRFASPRRNIESMPAAKQWKINTLLYLLFLKTWKLTCKINEEVLLNYIKELEILLLNRYWTCICLLHLGTVVLICNYIVVMKCKINILYWNPPQMDFLKYSWGCANEIQQVLWLAGVPHVHPTQKMEKVSLREGKHAPSSISQSCSFRWRAFSLVARWLVAKGGCKSVGLGREVKSCILFARHWYHY